MRRYSIRTREEMPRVVPTALCAAPWSTTLTPSLRDSLVPYGLMIVPAAVAAAFDWRWWIAGSL